jgi:hypothetical protein
MEKIAPLLDEEVLLLGRMMISESQGDIGLCVAQGLTSVVQAAGDAMECPERREASRRVLQVAG